MARRKKLTRRLSKKVFRKGARTHKKNLGSKHVMRGGIRL